LRHLTQRDVLLALSVAPAVILGRMWKVAGDRGGRQEPAEPFRIAGNFYYVGVNDGMASQTGRPSRLKAARV
jgi:hypothetical protein